MAEAMSDGAKPYLESATLRPPAAEEAKGDDAPIGELNRETFKEKLSKSKISVIAVFGKKCTACKDLEP